MSEMHQHDPAGNRLYLNAEERTAFLAAPTSLATVSRFGR